MDNMKMTNIPARQHCVAEGNITTGANEVLDDDLEKRQSEINAEQLEHNQESDNRVEVLENTTVRFTPQFLTENEQEQARQNIGTYSKDQVNNIVSRTPETDVIVIDIPAASQSDIAGWLDANTPSGIDPETGKSVRANKLYRVPGPTNTTFSEWAWDGTKYIMLDNKDYGIDDYPTINSNNTVKSGGVERALHDISQNLHGKTLMGPVYVANERFMITGNSDFLRGNPNFECWRFDVDPNNRYFYSGKFSDNIQIYYIIIRDENDNYLEGVNYISTATNVRDASFVTPANAKYVYLNVEKTNKDTFFIYKYTDGEGIRLANLLSIKSYGLSLDNYWMHYFYDSRGLVSFDLMSVYRFKVKPNYTYKFSGKYPAGINVCFVCFADPNGDFLSYSSYAGSSSVDVEYTDQEITTPNGCGYVYFNVFTEYAEKAKFEIWDIPSLDFESLSKSSWDSRPVPGSDNIVKSGGIDASIHVVEQKVDGLSTLTPYEVIDNSFEIDDGQHSNPNFQVWRYNIVPNKTYFFSGRFGTDVGIKFVYVFDSEDNYLNSYGSPDTEHGIIYKDSSFIINNATAVRISLNVEKTYIDAFVMAEDSRKNNTTVDNLIALKSYGLNIEDSWIHYFYDQRGLVANVNMGVIKFKVEGNTKYTFSNKLLAGTNTDSICYADANDNFLGYSGKHGSTTEDTVFTDEPITTPGACRYVYMNYNLLCADIVKFNIIDISDVAKVFQSRNIEAINEVVTPYDVTDGKFVLGNEERSNPNMQIWRYNVTPFKQYLISGTYSDVQIPMGYWMDKDGNSLSAIPIVGPNISAQDQILSAPIGAERLYISVEKTYMSTFSVIENGINTDMTETIKAALKKNGHCKLGHGLFYVNSLDMPEFSRLEGSGNTTKIVLLGNGNGYAIRISRYNQVSNIMFLGEFKESPIIVEPISGTKVDGYGIGRREQDYLPIKEEGFSYYTFPVVSGENYHINIPSYQTEETYYPLCIGGEIVGGVIANGRIIGNAADVGFDGDITIPDGVSCVYISVKDVVPTVIHKSGFMIEEPEDVNTISIGNRHGILFLGSGNSTDMKGNMISNCEFMYFSGGAITCDNTGYGSTDSLLVSDCKMQKCGAGINIAYFSEFNRFTNITANFCSYGLINNGGNNNFVNCDFTGNGIGVYFNGASNKALRWNGVNTTATNTAHGLMSCCTINHSGLGNHQNSGYAIVYLNTGGGFVFTGMQIHYGKLMFRYSGDIQMNNVRFGNQVEIKTANTWIIVFSNITFGSNFVFKVYTDSAMTIEDTAYLSDGNLQRVKLINSYFSSGDIASIQSLN